MTPRPSEVAALSDALVSAARVRIHLDQLWQLWTVAAPRLHGVPHQGADLAAALTTIVEQGVIELPARAWDRTTTPPLPSFVTVPAARAGQRHRPWATFPWCPQLGWVASLLSLTEQRFADLVAINDWLIRAQSAPPVMVPMRYRSAELFGDEKRLDSMLRTNLFGAGRLSLDLLGCTRIPPPLAAARVGDGPDVLVMENSDPYWAAVDTLKSARRHPIGVVAWGAGNSFPSQVPALAVDVAGHGPAQGIVWYWGDMDPEGLAIAAEASRCSEVAGGPVIRPAQQLWMAMADVPVQNPGTVDWSNTATGRRWLGDALCAHLDGVCSAAGRVAQESVPHILIAKWAEQIGQTGSSSTR
jgi:hypothetical protein